MWRRRLSFELLFEKEVMMLNRRKRWGSVEEVEVKLKRIYRKAGILRDCTEA